MAKMKIYEIARSIQQHTADRDPRRAGYAAAKGSADDGRTAEIRKNNADSDSYRRKKLFFL